MKESGFYPSTDSPPLAMEDVVSRDPYDRDTGDGATLNVIYAIDRTGELKELSRLSGVVNALTKYEAYRIYVREEDASTRNKLDSLIEEHCHG